MVFGVEALEVKWVPVHFIYEGGIFGVDVRGSVLDARECSGFYEKLLGIVKSDD